MINILLIHQSAELYGSDKTLLLLLQNLNRAIFNPVVILPNEGPLKVELEKLNIEICIAPVLKLHRKMFSPKNLILFSKQIREGLKQMNSLHKKYHFDIVYSNTLAVLLGIIFASRKKIQHVWHVHEIIESPLVINMIFSKLMALKSNSVIVYNSLATQHFWNTTDVVRKKAIAIQNGQQLSQIDFSDSDRNQLRKVLFKADSEVVIALVGRISRWKGQLVLLEAFEILAKKHEKIKLVFVGSTPPGQEEFLEILQHQILQKNLQEKVVILPFQEQITAVWHSIDIAVVPSTEPEPFGLVALEAMLAQKPVVASDHGGLSEIVVHNQTGFLIKPSDINALSNALEQLIQRADLRQNFGKNGYDRAQEVFSVEQYITKFESLFNKMASK